MAAKPFEFRVGQKFEGVHTGNVREITGIASYTVDYTIHYADGRKSSLYGVSKRQVREMLDAGDIRLVA